MMADDDDGDDDDTDADDDDAAADDDDGVDDLCQCDMYLVVWPHAGSLLPFCLKGAK